MLFLHSSHKQSLRPIGSHILPCPNCEQEQPHVLYHNVQQDSLYSVKVMDTLLHRISFCDICGTPTRLTTSEVITTAPFWTVDIPITKLAEETHYILGDPSVKPLNSKTIAKMLKNIANFKLRQDTTIKIKDLLIAIAAGVLSHYVFKIIRAGHDDENPIYAVMVVVIALFVGLIGSVMYRYRKITSNARKDVLIIQLEKLRLSVDDVKRLLDGRANEDPTIKALLEQVSPQNKLNG